MPLISAPVSPQFEKIKALVAAAEADVAKFDKGTKAAGPRVRKAMQALKLAAQGIRETVVQK